MSIQLLGSNITNQSLHFYRFKFYGGCNHVLKLKILLASWFDYDDKCTNMVVYELSATPDFIGDTEKVPKSWNFGKIHTYIRKIFFVPSLCILVLYLKFKIINNNNNNGMIYAGHGFCIR